MFNKDHIKTLKEQISYLQAVIKDKDKQYNELIEKFMALNAEAFEQYSYRKEFPYKDLEQPKIVNPLGELEKQEAITDEDKKNKEMAKQIYLLFSIYGEYLS